MALPGRDRENTRGNHGILTAVDLCFGEGVGCTAGFYRRTEKACLTLRGRRWATKWWLGELATAMEVAQHVL
jgi:hypothetical protein